MNEHDSERLAGALIADGLVATPDLESADVVVFNTCCIRENADNKFYGHLGNLKTLRESRPDMQIAVGGCLAQMDKERIRERASHVDVVFGTHNLTRAPALLRQAAASGPVVEILDEPLPPPIRPPTTSRWPHWPPSGTFPTRRGSPSRPGATTPAPSASCPRSGAARCPAPSTTWWPKSGPWPGGA